MDDTLSIQKVEAIFFQALRDKNAAVLEEVLGADFVIVDVFKGNETDKPAFVTAMAAESLQFHVIECRGSRIRLYKDTAVVVGETRMAGQFSGAPFDIQSRYTHVYVRTAASWKLVSAQGTPIVSQV